MHIKLSIVLTHILHLKKCTHNFSPSTCKDTLNKKYTQQLGESMLHAVCLAVLTCLHQQGEEEEVARDRVTLGWRDRQKIVLLLQMADQLCDTLQHLWREGGRGVTMTPMRLYKMLITTKKKRKLCDLFST